MIVQLVLTGVAYWAAISSDNPIIRVLALGFLIARGAMLLIAGIFGGFSLVPVLLGVGLLVLAAQAWTK